MAVNAHGPRRRSRLIRRWASLRESASAQLWPLPVAAILLGVALGIALPVLDSSVDATLPDSTLAWVFAGGAPSARAVLSAIAGSLITATSLTFSLTVVALQLASSQASPRVLRMFARDSTVHATLAIFLGTFAYALTTLRAVEDETATGAAVVPRIAVTVASLLTLVSVVMLVLFLAHLSRTLRVETIMRNVHDETSATIALVRGSDDEGSSADQDAPSGAMRHVVPATGSGFLSAIDRFTLVRTATAHGIIIAEEHSVGSSVIEGTPLVSWWSESGRPLSPNAVEALAATVNAACHLNYERTSSQDIGFGLRQLVDMVSKALSPGINDPTTAVHALSHISAILCALARLRPQPNGLLDDDGNLRLIIRPHDFDALLNLAVEQPRRYGASDPDVIERLYALLREVAFAACVDEQRASIRSQLDRLGATVAASDFDAAERAQFAGAVADAENALKGRWH